MNKPERKLLVCSKKGDRLFLCESLCGTPNCEEGLIKGVSFEDYCRAISCLRAKGSGSVVEFLSSNNEY